MLTIFHSVIAQSKKDTVICTGLQVVTTRSTIENYPFNKVINISKESLKNGFKLISSDSNWMVDGFWYTYDCEGCDIYRRYVLGNTVNVDDHFIFKKLRKGELLDFTCINIERNRKRYITQSFSVFVTD
jgi:hypothetical protein